LIYNDRLRKGSAYAKTELHIVPGLCGENQCECLRNYKCPRFGTLCLICLMLASMAGCTKSTLAVKLQPIDLEVVEVEQRDVSICGQWIGTLDGFVNPNVKAQVTGYLLRQDYKEGSFVKKGQWQR
jgi:multidrug efflux pump subunit AcrA (membrane-fusion protein)